MRILYLPHFESSPTSEFCRLLQAQSEDCVLRAGGIVPSYRSRWQLYCRWWPRLTAFGMASAWRHGRSSDVVAAWSHLVLLPFLAMKAVGLCRSRLVLVGFIYTGRQHRIIAGVRWWYFRLLLACMDLVIVHSTFEAVEYARLFHQPAEKFAYVPLSAHMAKPPTPRLGAARTVVSAGRSNRDYRLLLACAPRWNVPVEIICDSFAGGGDLPANVTVRTACHGGDYLQALADAAVVVVPLRRDEMSAGQMVLLHAMALAKPVVITRTKGTTDYVEDGKTGLFMEPGSESDMDRQVRRVLDDPELASRLGRTAREHFETHHTLAASLRALHALICRRFESGEGQA